MSRVGTCAECRSAFCSRPPASTDTARVYFFTSSLLFLTLHPGHCQTQTLAVFSNLQTPREAEHRNKSRTQRSNFKQEEPSRCPGTGTLAATSECMLQRRAVLGGKPARAGGAFSFKTVSPSPERMWIKECSWSLCETRFSYNMSPGHQDKVCLHRVCQHIDRSPACTGRNQQTYTTHSRSPP